VKALKSKLWFLTKYSLDKKIKTKAFVIVNIILLVLLVGLTNIDKIVSFFGGDFNKVTNISVIDKTNMAFDMFSSEVDKNKSYIETISKYKITKVDSNQEKTIEDKLSKTSNILIIIEKDSNNYMKAKVVADKYNDTILYQVIASALNNTKAAIALSISNISIDELTKVYTPIVIEKVAINKSDVDGIDMIMGTVFPTLILPFFILVIFVIQMIGLEINEEKTTKGMEIIISNVSPRTHFFSKVIASNAFVFIQAFLLFIYGVIGLLTRGIYGQIFNISGSVGVELNKFWDSIVSSGVAERLIYVIPLTLVLFVLSFLAYSLVAGILASITVNIEDYQQIQTPIIIVSLIGYYLSMLAGVFEGSIFIKIASYIPFISALLSPALLILGQISIIDVLISIVLLVLTLYLLIKYGLKVYKVGILNYSSDKLWSRLFKAIKTKDLI
jgi:ABC-2 type transport system permease protein